MTDPAHSHTIFNGNSLDVSFLGVYGVVVVYIHDNITSCVNVLVLQPLDRMLFSGALLSSWVI